MDFDVPIQTTVHVVISLVAIASGAVVAYGFLAAKRLDLWTASLLVTTVLTSVLARLVRWYNESRLHSALGYLPPAVVYRGNPEERKADRRRKLAQARHHRRERNLGLQQGTLPFTAGEVVASP